MRGGAVVRSGGVVVSVAASSANIGPGFDSVGLALDLRDTVEVRVRPACDGADVSTEVFVGGAGAGQVPTDARHLVAATVRSGLAELVPAARVDLRLRCDNSVPHGQGLGSSAAAVVAGHLAAWTLVHGEPRDGAAASERCEWLVDRSSAAEGHGDNASASVLGGAVAAWSDGTRFRAVTLEIDPDLELVTCVPRETLATDVARSLLPHHVPHVDAAFTGGRAILLAEALRGRRDVLLAGTEDRLHQQQRAAAMPGSLELMGRLRERGIAATVSGAGPALLCLGSAPDVVAGVAGPGWAVRRRLAGSAARVERLLPTWSDSDGAAITR